MSINDGQDITSTKKNPVWMIVLDSSSENQSNSSNQIVSNEQNICAKINKDNIVPSKTLLRQVIKKRRRINRKLLEKKTKQKRLLKALKESQKRRIHFHNQKFITFEAKNLIKSNHQSHFVKDKQTKQNLQTKENTIKSKMKKKFTIKKQYCLQHQFFNHSNDPYVDIMFDYPFLQDEDKNEVQYNIFKNRLKSIVSINKLQNSQDKKIICFIFYEEQFEKMKNRKHQNYQDKNYQKNKAVEEIIPKTVELDKIRLLYPQKLLEFYILADDYYYKKSEIKQKQLKLNQKTQERIKYLLK